MRKFLIALLVLVMSALFSACGGGGETSQDSSLSPEAQRGKQIATAKCGSCHTTDGKSAAGPTWKGLAGSQVTLTNGQTVTADDAYLKRAISDPDADIVDGYGKVMSAAVPKGSISESDVNDIVAYLNTLR